MAVGEPLHGQQSQRMALTCALCGITCGCASSLARHRGNIHGVTGRNVCVLCGDGFSTSQGLQCHMEQVHRQDGGATTRTQSGVQLVPRVPILAKTTRKRPASAAVSSPAKRVAQSSSSSLTTGQPRQPTEDVRCIAERVPEQRRLEQLFPPGQSSEQQTLPLEQTPIPQQTVPEHHPPTRHTPPPEHPTRHTPPPNPPPARHTPPPDHPPARHTPPPDHPPEQIPTHSTNGRMSSVPTPPYKTRAL